MDVVFQLNQSVFNYRVAAVWIQHQHILLHRLHNESHWSLPGGRVAFGEDSRSSLARELREELGIDVNVERLLWTVENFFPYNGKHYHEIGLYYAISCEQAASLFTPDPFHGPEGERLVYQWTPLGELEDVPLYPAFLRTALQRLPVHPEHVIIRQ
jgi:ADP-ribose pyrophosphatase YjhB (NUDIX family)